MEFKNGDKVLNKKQDGFTYIGLHPSDSNQSVLYGDSIGLLYADNEFLTLAPKTITLCGIEFPEPVREDLNDGDEYWYVEVKDVTAYSYKWRGDDVDELLLKRGLIQLTKEGAELQRKAMIKSVGGEV